MTKAPYVNFCQLLLKVSGKDMVLISLWSVSWPIGVGQVHSVQAFPVPYSKCYLNFLLDSFLIFYFLEYTLIGLNILISTKLSIFVVGASWHADRHWSYGCSVELSFEFDRAVYNDKLQLKHFHPARILCVTFSSISKSISNMDTRYLNSAT